MAESTLFDIFGDHHTRQTMKNGSRQPFPNNENMGKMVITGPVKPNEPMKKAGEPKKSFLSNTGKALQSTPARKMFSPRTLNVGSLIYTDDNTLNNDKGFNFEEIEFTKPSRKYDYHSQLFDFLIPEPKIAEEVSPPPTPPPQIKRCSMELDCSYEDEFFTDDFSNDGLNFHDDSDLGLPALY